MDCSEVRWNVLAHSVELSKKKAFEFPSEVFNSYNNNNNKSNLLKFLITVNYTCNAHKLENTSVNEKQLCNTTKINKKV